MGDNATRRGFWGAVARWAASDAEVDAEELRDDAREAGCQSLAEVPERSRVKVRGTLRSVTLQPRQGTPALEAELFDGSDSVTLVWLGRRRIAGISCGRRLTAVGRVATLDGRRVMFNPRYELQPSGTE
ncbi:ATP-dependent DNA helicase RecG [Haloactinopolyspora alba]|uniref:ATP-dependent DNA helicase RecG n=1 Tax=Haloactinopolyspora alba TaxID=648780 RepID=A0A2P8E2M2_9ACTN|nr:OB-fold nucleic acid binding domain-containing protein [Haloactinopolyspora alba]PSL03724.1 ATP-dependent DNA helicase RecG [Haloactinopolyspora alba]